MQVLQVYQVLAPRFMAEGEATEEDEIDLSKLDRGEGLDILDKEKDVQETRLNLYF